MKRITGIQKGGKKRVPSYIEKAEKRRTLHWYGVGGTNRELLGQF